MPTYSEFCCRASGDNLNAGSVDGSTTEPSGTPLAVYTGGDWDAATDVYTAPVGADVTAAVVDRFASVYVDGITAPATGQWLVGRITAVNAATRQITLGASRANYGTEVATGAGNRSMRIGGAWYGPTGAFAFPGAVVSTALVRTVAGRVHRINMKNDRVYSVSTSVVIQTSTALWGYSTAYADGGYAIIDGGTAGASFVLLDAARQDVNVAFLELRNNGATGSAAGINVGSVNRMFAYRLRVHDVRGTGVLVGCPGDVLECETYACNQANLTATAGMRATVAGVTFRRCVSRDNVGTLNDGFYSTQMGTAYDECVAKGNGRHGYFQNANGNGASWRGSIAYGNVTNGFHHDGPAGVNWFENCVAVNNGRGFNVASGSIFGAFYNSAGFGNTNADLIDVTMEQAGYVALSGNPFVDAPNGDFRLNNTAGAGAALKALGRSVFPGWAAPTVGYPDIGAAQSQPTAGGGGSPRILVPGWEVSL